MVETDRRVWKGTRDLLESLADESTREPAWRLRRSALAHALKDGPTMTAEQFDRWFVMGKMIARKAGEPLPHDALGFSRREPAQYATGRAIPLTIALACAHWQFGHELPCEPKPVPFTAWFTACFGNAGRISDYLGLRADYIGARMRGYALREEGRVMREPEPVLLRALDWVHRHGPVNPWNAEPARSFPETWEID